MSTVVPFIVPTLFLRMSRLDSLPWSNVETESYWQDQTRLL